MQEQPMCSEDADLKEELLKMSGESSFLLAEDGVQDKLLIFG